MIGGGTFLAYQYDLCWGTKLERVKKMADEILLEDHWFNPPMLPREDILLQIEKEKSPKNHL